MGLLSGIFDAVFGTQAPPAGSVSARALTPQELTAIEASTELLNTKRGIIENTLQLQSQLTPGQITSALKQIELTNAQIQAKQELLPRRQQLAQEQLNLAFSQNMLQKGFTQAAMDSLGDQTALIKIQLKNQLRIQPLQGALSEQQLSTALVNQAIAARVEKLQLQGVATSQPLLNLLRESQIAAQQAGVDLQNLTAPDVSKLVREQFNQAQVSTQNLDKQNQFTTSLLSPTADSVIKGLADLKKLRTGQPTDELKTEEDRLFALVKENLARQGVTVAGDSAFSATADSTAGQQKIALLVKQFRNSRQKEKEFLTGQLSSAIAQQSSFITNAENINFGKELSIAQLPTAQKTGQLLAAPITPNTVVQNTAGQRTAQTDLSALGLTGNALSTIAQGNAGSAINSLGQIADRFGQTSEQLINATSPFSALRTLNAGIDQSNRDAKLKTDIGNAKNNTAILTGALGAVKLTGTIT